MRRGRTRFDRPTAARRLRLALCALCVSGLAGCGDGGSSGFDLSAQQRAEQRVIADVAQNNACMELDGTVICGAAIPGSGPVVPDISAPVTLSPPDGAPLPCFGDASTGCSMTIRITGGRLPDTQASIQAGSTLRLAAGPIDPPSGWVPGEAVTYAENGEADADLDVRLLQGGAVPLVTGTAVRAAVLVYPPGTQVPNVPSRVNLLADFDAGAAVVVNDLVLELMPIPRQ
jgi:hypothetical protein